MAKPSVMDEAIAHLDRQMADLQRAKDLILAVAVQTGAQFNEPAAPRKRGRKRKAGLPTVPDTGE